MSQVPTMLAQSPGYPTNAGSVAQFLGAHTAAYLYSGAVVQAQQATGTGVYQTTQSQWLSQTITMGSSQTILGSIGLQLSAVGGSPTLPLTAPVSVGLYADVGGVPSGSALATVTLSGQYVYSAPFWLQVPFGLAVTAGGTYHVVVSPVGTSSHYYLWQQSNQLQGAATAPDGALWTTQAYGLMWQVLDSTPTGQLLSVSEDNGQLITSFTYTSLGLVATVTQFAVTQTGSSIQSSGTLSYTNGLLTGVS